MRKGKQPLSKQVKRGLANAFTKFSAYQLAKWNRPTTVKLRDVLFLVHAKPKDAEQAALWKSLVEGSLEPADTWEVALSGGADKKATWERLLTERKLGYSALLMNLHNMIKAKVAPDLVERALIDGAPKSKALPFRFLSAAKHAPQYVQALSDGMCAAVTGNLPGRTALVIDVSGSMDDLLSAKSTLTRWEAAAGLAILLREMAASCRVFTFSNALVEVGNLRGLALAQAIGASQWHGATQLSAALKTLQPHTPEIERLVVVTDEQTHDGIFAPWVEKAYLVNVGPYKPGLETSSGWTRISGWSERLVDWILLEETGKLAVEGSDDD